jgi:hypothetical protein
MEPRQYQIAQNRDSILVLVKILVRPGPTFEDNIRKDFKEIVWKGVYWIDPA